MPDSDTSKYEPVAKTTLTLTMIHPVGLKPAEMPIDDIAYHLGDGEFVGERTSCETVPLADDEVAGELEKLGGHSDNFIRIEAADPAAARR